MTEPPAGQAPDTTTPPPPDSDEKSDLRVVLQFFIVPLSLVAVLVLLFFGLQLVRSRTPDPATTLSSLQNYEGFLSSFVGDIKRWQYGYDLSLLMRGKDAQSLRRMLPGLVQAFNEAGTRRDLKLRRYLALALGHSGDPRAVAPLRDGLRDADAETRLFCAWGLMNAADRAALPDLRAAARDSDPGVRKMAVHALGRMHDRESIPALREALVDPADDVRWNAALSLALLGDQSASPVLVALLEASLGPDTEPGLAAAADGDNDDGNSRRDWALNSIRGLALLKAPKAKALLVRLTSSAGDPAIREAAALAIAAYGPERAAGVP